MIPEMPSAFPREFHQPTRTSSLRSSKVESDRELWRCLAAGPCVRGSAEYRRGCAVRRPYCESEFGRSCRLTFKSPEQVLRSIIRLESIRFNPDVSSISPTTPRPHGSTSPTADLSPTRPAAFSPRYYRCPPTLRTNVWRGV